MLILISVKLSYINFIILGKLNTHNLTEADNVTVELSSEKDLIIISITDFGIGISKLELKSIFSPFIRGKNVDLIQGTGLGLSIVKEAVGLIGAEVTVNSTEGKGSCFIMRIKRS